MTTPTHVSPVAGAASPLTPERWRAVDAILQAALACEPARREAVVAAACGDDEALRLEITSLLASHLDTYDDFLEKAAADTFAASSHTTRLSTALAGRYAIEREIARGGMATV